MQKKTKKQSIVTMEKRKNILVDKNNEKGITLIALAVTIVIILILAGVGIGNIASNKR